MSTERTEQVAFQWRPSPYWEGEVPFVDLFVGDAADADLIHAMLERRDEYNKVSSGYRVIRTVVETTTTILETTDD